MDIILHKKINYNFLFMYYVSHILLLYLHIYYIWKLYMWILTLQNNQVKKNDRDIICNHISYWIFTYLKSRIIYVPNITKYVIDVDKYRNYESLKDTTFEWTKYRHTHENGLTIFVHFKTDKNKKYYNLLANYTLHTLIVHIFTHVRTCINFNK